MYRKAGDFETPLLEIREQIRHLIALDGFDDHDARERLEELQRELHEKTGEIYSRLSPWEKVQVARHPDRPYTLDYLEHMTEDFAEVHGDRRFADDGAIVAGFATFRGREVAVVGHQKGRTTTEKIARNFGMGRPEGYRKAARVMELAEKFRLPLLSFIDTAGAFPGIDAEERGQAEAIARNLRLMASLTTPFIATITGEGGSGGALAIGMGDVVNILEFSVYSVISPEGCAAILWKDAAKAPEAAQYLGLTPDVLKKFGLVDEVISEVQGGAHTDPEGMAKSLGDALERQLGELEALPPEERRERRYAKFRRMGAFLEEADA
ncbi:MAG: acetyl-CoA carboxylase carboxyltransferase subunit alpha [Acidobacteriota bacterium]|nr:MAG: acetyl-CoA carboxylase carboxyltransferase subunit alpha [Acidobacteriota bacterium]